MTNKKDKITSIDVKLGFNHDEENFAKSCGIKNEGILERALSIVEDVTSKNGKIVYSKIAEGLENKFSKRELVYMCTTDLVQYIDREITKLKIKKSILEDL